MAAHRLPRLAARASEIAARLRLDLRRAAQPGRVVSADETAALPHLRRPAAEPTRVDEMVARRRLRPVPRNRAQLPIPHGPAVTRRIPR
ncbi:hypothetical protein [Nocardia sp. CA-120079]|uniref:hypothetical protein n=1 Tax=Nocardia sp. CA-120079 TaxID=3239974 RepID=UPI003D99DEC0